MRAQACALALIAAVPLLAVPGRVAAADTSTGYCAPPTDTVPPAITAVALSRRTVNLSKGSQTLTVTVHAEDKSAGQVSGVRRIKVDAYRRHQERAILLTLEHGTPADGTWVGSFRFTKHDLSGDWVLRLFEITDRAGNDIYYIRNVGAAPNQPYDPRLHPAWQQTFTLTGTPSSASHRAGHPTSLSMTPSVVNATQATRTVHVRASFSGPIPRRVQFQIGGEGRGDGRFVGRIFLDRHGEYWTGLFPVGRWVGDETARAMLIERFHADVRPSNTFFYPPQLEARGLSDKLRLVSGRDSTPPTLDAFSFTPTAVDTTSRSEVVNVTAQASDPQSAVDAIYVRFDYGTSKPVPIQLDVPDGSHALTNDVGTSAEPFVRLVRHGVTWTGSLTIPGCVAGGSWKAGVYVHNGAGRGRDYDDAQLRAAGLSDNLQVTSSAVDTDPPSISSATVDGVAHTIAIAFDHPVFNVSPATLTIYSAVPSASRYDDPLTIADITCSADAGTLPCDGSAGGVTTAVLDVPSVSAGASYEVWANLHQVVPQIVDAEGYALDPEYGPQGRAGVS